MLVEPISLDEAFLDVRAATRLAGEPRDMAETIKRRIREETGGLTASAGVAPDPLIEAVPVRRGMG